jgi:hypothetical protein
VIDKEKNIRPGSNEELLEKENNLLNQGVAVA